MASGEEIAVTVASRIRNFPQGTLPWVGDHHQICDPIAMLLPAYIAIESAARRKGFDPDRSMNLSNRDALISDFGDICRRSGLEYDPEKWVPVFRKIMLKQEARALERFNRKL